MACQQLKKVTAKQNTKLKITRKQNKNYAQKSLLKNMLPSLVSGKLVYVIRKTELVIAKV